MTGQLIAAGSDDVARTRRCPTCGARISARLVSVCPRLPRLSIADASRVDRALALMRRALLSLTSSSTSPDDRLERMRWSSVVHERIEVLERRDAESVDVARIALAAAVTTGVA